MDLVVGGVFERSSMDCIASYVRTIQATCTWPMDAPTPCYKNTSVDLVLMEINQVKDESIYKMASACCQTSLCTADLLREDVCCKGKHCRSQCFGPSFLHSLQEVQTWPITKDKVLQMPQVLSQNSLSEMTDFKIEQVKKYLEQKKP
uniref:Uncharacterized protein n=1 Tax=Panagrolaimus sp. JU765 TaxID=591449 RepID=A0AC34QNJ3_9BILA